MFNANYRTVKGKLIEIPVQPATEYTDLWKGAPVTTSIHGSTASLVVEIGPRDVACISTSEKEPVIYSYITARISTEPLVPFSKTVT